MTGQKGRRRYEAVLFDVGDTLLTKTPTDFHVFAGRCQEAGISIGLDAARKGWKQSEKWVTEQFLREMAGKPRIPDLEFLKQPDYVALKTAFAQKNDVEIRKMVSYILPLQGPKQTWKAVYGIHETLDKLKNMDYKLGIVSNFDDTLPKVLEKFDLGRYFDIVVTPSLAGVEKPDPEILKIACRLMKTNPGDSVYVGDHPFDVLCAKKAGMSMVWICDESDTLPELIQYKPDCRLTSAVDLEVLLS